MGWFLNLVRPQIKSNQDSAIPENLWKSCPKCAEMIFIREWEVAYCVCPKCGFHDKLDAISRVSLLSDTSPNWIDLPQTPDDPLKFEDQKLYKDRLRDARLKTGLRDAVVAAEISIKNQEVILFVMDFNFIGGSMGTYVGAAFSKSVERAILKDIPLVVVSASGGARMQEGIYSLMQMPRTTLGCEMLRERGVPYIVVLSNPTTGGVIASFAMLGDVILAEPGALIGFTGPRVIEETMGITLPPEFQKSEFQLAHGFIDCIIHRADLKNELAKIISILNSENRSKRRRK